MNTSDSDNQNRKRGFVLVSKEAAADKTDEAADAEALNPK